MVKQIKDLLKYASINEHGGILLGKNIVVDGFDYRDYRVITHAHSDHTQGLNKSLQVSKYIILTNITYDIMKSLGMIRHKYINKYVRVKYGEKIRTNEEELVLIKADHIPGAAQVIVELDDLLIAYTGDFKNPGKGTPIVKNPDVLVIESTYGKPEWTRPFKDEVEELFVDLVKELLSRGPVYIYGFHGKIQEAMIILRSHGIDTPFIASSAVYRVTKALEKHGYWFGKVFSHVSLEAREVMRDGWYIFFSHTNNIYNHNINNASLHGLNRIILTGWEFNEPYKRVKNNTWIVALSDHADFEQLLYYVSESKPELVIVDNYRQGAGEIFAREIRRRLGIPAIPQPSSIHTLDLI